MKTPNWKWVFISSGLAGIIAALIAYFVEHGVPRAILVALTTFFIAQIYHRITDNQNKKNSDL
ncbi:hypothetical protein [Bacillus nitroreducens]